MTEFAEDVIRFWFEELGEKGWFEKSDRVDDDIRSRFGATQEQLCVNRDAAFEAAETPRGALAVLIVLDQFSRNLFRGDGRAFAADPLARDIARRSIVRGDHLDPSLPPGAAKFFILPFEHSEEPADQDWCCALCAVVDDPLFLDFAERHRDIIRRFGRFPHRNSALGRTSTSEEKDFLTQPGSSF